jgi:hypothetical protein
MKCISCGQSQSLARIQDLGPSPDVRYRRALEYARAHGVDLASAYSVLLGLMPLERARSVRAEQPTAGTPSTPQEAKRRQASSENTAIPAAGGSISKSVWPVALAATLLVLTILLVRGTGPGDPVAAGPPPDRWDSSVTEVRTDEQGNLLAVSAPDPALVLLGYCEPEPSSRRCDPLQLQAAVPARPGVRVGVFRDIGSDDRQAITIRRMESARTWKAGDDRQPIRVVAAPAAPPGTLTIPVSRHPAAR